MADNRELDCCYVRDGKWFRYRVGAIIIEEGCVLFATNAEAKYYYSVGGGVHHGESSRDAVEREVFEETGVRYEVDRLAFVHENFFTDDTRSLKGLDCHELALFYIMKPRGTKELPAHTSTCLDGEERVVWVPIEKLGEVNAFPTFYREWLKKLPESGIVHIVTNDKKA